MLSFGFRVRRVMICTRWLLPLIVVSLSAIGQTPEITGTLPEDYLPGLRPILVSAVRQAPEILLAEIGIARKEGEFYDRGHERWPRVGGNIRYDSTQTSVSGGNDSSSYRDSGLFYDLSVDQAVFHWGQILNNTAVGRVEVAIAKKQYQEAYRRLAVMIRSSYLDLVARKANLRRLHYSIELREAELKAVRDRNASGASSAGDVAGKEFELADFKAGVEEEEITFEGRRQELIRLAGLTELPVEQIPVEIPVAAFKADLAAQIVAEVLRDGGKSAFAAQVADMQIREANLQYKIARTRLLPMFNAALSTSRESNTNVTDQGISQHATDKRTFELRGSWNIFDGFATRGAKVMAQADKRRAERVFEKEATATMDDVQRLQRLVALSARRVQLAEQSRAGALNLLNIRKQEVAVGSGSAGSIEATQAEIFTAEAALATRRAAFLAYWSELVSRSGMDPVMVNVPWSYVRATR